MQPKFTYLIRTSKWDNRLENVGIVHTTVLHEDYWNFWQQAAPQIQNVVLGPLSVERLYNFSNVDDLVGKDTYHE